MNEIRKVIQVIEPQMVIEGADVLLRRSISPQAANSYDPFLLFDHFAFNNPVEGPIRGFPTHPHRGIETVTYMLEGSVNHRDSLGNQGLIGPGDVQWMTAGGGIMHEEMPRRGPNGAINGFQLWVNLPKRLKMSRPRYQEVNAETIPTISKNGAAIRLVAGKVSGTSGPVGEIAAEPLYMDVKLEPGVAFTHPVARGYTLLAYLFEGEAIFGGETFASAVRMLVFGDGEAFSVQAPPGSGARFMLIAGAPFAEPIMPYGPFVMNTREEIQQALVDLRSGTFVWNERDPRFTI